MTEQESKDLAELKEAIKAEKIACFEYQVALVRMDPKNLIHVGHKTLESGVMSSVKSSMAKIKKLTDAYVKKYPD